MAKTEYQRLTRARARRGFAVAIMSRTSLWLGADHLLFIDSSGYTETYKRFYFRDIQAITVHQTRQATIVNIVLTVCLVLTLTIGLAVQTVGLNYFFFILAGVFGLFLVANFLPGRTCRCFLRTAVQIEELPSLNRVGRAQKVLEKIRPLIAAAQGGELSPATVSEMLQPPAAGPTTGSPEIPPVIDR